MQRLNGKTCTRAGDRPASIESVRQVCVETDCGSLRAARNVRCRVGGAYATASVRRTSGFLRAKLIYIKSIPRFGHAVRAIAALRRGRRRDRVARPGANGSLTGR
ncbi:hypothetical protein Bcep1808_1348 [Burkholderia vietnamiensis G4]|uniref:Uncharacterized protein n=1 Tax=Burkholderia vietnamiensis (strain G4 / LMG 22486) TaxID=269482 RepID=A4JDK5_BURVG|nr:hypothetical protein Bcep1808_1348 [Burkholderia vietnamiensis G4]